MSNYYQNVKITEGNEFSLLIPIKTRSYNENGSFVDEVIDARLLTECVVMFGNVEYEPRLLEEGVLINLPANLARATYSVIVTAKHRGVAVRAALFQAITIVAWSYQSNAELFLPNSPIVLDAAFVIRPYSQSEDAMITTYNYLHSRLSGNAEYGIPAKMPIIEDGEVLDTNLANLDRYLHLLDGRDMVSGLTLTLPSDNTIALPDGISFAQLVCSDLKGYVTEIIDDNTGWTALYATNAQGKSFVLGSLFPNARRVVLGVRETNYKIHFANAEEIILHTNKIISQYTERNNTGFVRAPNAKVYADELTSATYGGNYGAELTFLAYCKEIYLRGIKSINIRIAGNEIYNPLRKVVFDTIDYMYEHNLSSQPDYFNFMRCLDLIHMEFGNWGGVVNASISLKGWSPTNALDASRTDLVEDPMVANNLLQFILNFREFLFLRLADRTGQTAKTLTLSSAVYTALTTETRTLAELGVTELTELEISAGITLDTPYDEWLDTYRAAINWTIAYV